MADGKVMTINQSHYILMEFAFDEDPDFATRLLGKVREVGAKPVIAHAERYYFVQDDPQIVYQWRKKGYAIQVNKGSFLGRFGESARETSYRLLHHHLVSVVASDAHSAVERTPFLMDAYEALSECCSKRHLDVLFRDNPGRICQDKPVLELEPLPFLPYYFD